MRYLLIKLIRCYQLACSPFFPASCRYTPSCSQYTITAVKKYGVVYGGFLALKRILSCHPFGNCGYDPVPDKKPEHK